MHPRTRSPRNGRSTISIDLPVIQRDSSDAYPERQQAGSVQPRFPPCRRIELANAEYSLVTGTCLLSRSACACSEASTFVNVDVFMLAILHDLENHVSLVLVEILWCRID